jgi:microcystin-dependent protein
MSEPFIAEIRIFAGNFAPRSWAFCNGQLLPIAQNTALFSLVGTTYGGDGRTTFGLPNLQGRAPMHPGRGPGLTDRRLGQSSGVETVSVTEAQMASHSHTARGSENTAVCQQLSECRHQRRCEQGVAANGRRSAAQQHAAVPGDVFHHRVTRRVSQPILMHATVAAVH